MHILRIALLILSLDGGAADFHGGKYVPATIEDFEAPLIFDFATPDKCILTFPDGSKKSVVYKVQRTQVSIDDGNYVFIHNKAQDILIGSNLRLIRADQVQSKLGLSKVALSEQLSSGVWQATDCNETGATNLLEFFKNGKVLFTKIHNSDTSANLWGWRTIHVDDVDILVVTILHNNTFYLLSNQGDQLDFKIWDDESKTCIGSLKRISTPPQVQLPLRILRKWKSEDAQWNHPSTLFFKDDYLEVTVASKTAIFDYKISALDGRHIMLISRGQYIYPDHFSILILRDDFMQIEYAGTVTDFVPEF